MQWIRLTPIYIVVILLIAHYLRIGNYGGMVFWAIIPFMLVLKWKWTTRLVQMFLIIGSLIWIESMYSIIQIRLANEQPWTKLLFISA